MISSSTMKIKLQKKKKGTKINQKKEKSRTNCCNIMYVSWPVPRGKGSNAAPQGDGIWDHLSMEELPKEDHQHQQTFLCDINFGICKHSISLLHSSKGFPV